MKWRAFDCIKKTVHIRIFDDVCGHWLAALAALNPHGEFMKLEEARIDALRKLISPEKVITALGYKCEPPKNLIAKLVNPNFQIFLIVKFEDGEGIVWDMKYRPETIKQCIAEGNLWMDEVGHEFKHR